MPSCPAAEHTSILRAAFLSAVMVILGVEGRSYNSARTAGRSASGCRAHTSETTAGSRRSAGEPAMRVWTARRYDACSANACARAKSLTLLASVLYAILWD
jgi:hypothetical protein